MNYSFYLFALLIGAYGVIYPMEAPASQDTVEEANTSMIQERFLSMDETSAQSTLLSMSLDLISLSDVSKIGAQKEFIKTLMSLLAQRAINLLNAYGIISSVIEEYQALLVLPEYSPEKLTVLKELNDHALKVQSTITERMRAQLASLVRGADEEELPVIAGAFSVLNNSADTNK